MKLLRGLTLAFPLLFSLASTAVALGPNDVYIVVNKNVAESQAVADHYCAKRGVPADHILHLDLPTGEDMTRVEYDSRLAGPLRELLKDQRDKVKVLLTVYGVPLRVGGLEPTAEDQSAAAEVRQQLEPLEQKRKSLDDSIKELEAQAKDALQDQAVKDLVARRNERTDLSKQMRPLERRLRFLTHQESHAAVDSELALLWYEGYLLRRFQPNLLNFKVSEEARQGKPPQIMTCRLDGPSLDLVKRLIDQAIETEAKGLQGKVYIDARGIKFTPKDGGNGYGGYDEAMRESAKLLGQAGMMDVTLDDKPELFSPGSCVECALYCGWYSHANFIDCCRFVPGAVAWHLASSEAVSLRDPNSKLWCKNLLEKGAAATLGPVAEPYTIGFPKPAEFFGTLVTGQYTLVETYWRTQLYASWMTVVVGDPLYNPYAKSPKLKIEQVLPSPAGAGVTPLRDE
jgi:uncharacterized protein (TIGR03790 family)